MPRAESSGKGASGPETQEAEEEAAARQQRTEEQLGRLNANKRSHIVFDSPASASCGSEDAAVLAAAERRRRTELQLQQLRKSR